MEITYQTFLIVCPFLFLAGLIDAIGGGGGLILGQLVHGGAGGNGNNYSSSSITPSNVSWASGSGGGGGSGYMPGGSPYGGSGGLHNCNGTDGGPGHGVVVVTW